VQASWHFHIDSFRSMLFTARIARSPFRHISSLVDSRALGLSPNLSAFKTTFSLSQGRPYTRSFSCCLPGVLIDIPFSGFLSRSTARFSRTRGRGLSFAPPFFHIPEGFGLAPGRDDAHVSASYPFFSVVVSFAPLGSFPILDARPAPP